MQMFEKAVLPNGLRVITSIVPYARSISIVIFVGAGSRYETESEAGASHFIEHLCFKGAQRWPTAKALSEAIEGVGGLINGGTDKELSIYWCKVASPHFPLALGVLSDMLLHSRLDPQEVEKERQVIIEEINMSVDSPAQRVGLLIDEVLWPDQPLGRDVAGTNATLAGFTREKLLEFMVRQYVPGNAVVSVAGQVEHQGVVQAVGEAFASWRDGKLPGVFAAQEAQDAPALKVEHRPTEQAHLCLALRGLSTLHPDRFALDLLNAILGEGMSSRLFLELRESRGLAYDIHSYITHLRDTGSWVIYAGVDPQKAPTALEAILRELDKLRQGVPEEEIAKAKEFVKGRLLLRLEDSRAVAGWQGAQELLVGQILTEEEALAKVDAITREDLLRVARNLVQPHKLNLAAVGPVSEAELSQKLKL